MQPLVAWNIVVNRWYFCSKFLIVSIKQLFARALELAMQNEDYSSTVRPFLTTFATLRTGSDEQVGRYCGVRRLWVIDTDGGVEPLVAFADMVGQTSTTTKINVEADDTDMNSELGLVTHTAVQAEADDVMRMAQDHAFVTQTFVAAEADDRDPDFRSSTISTTTRVLAETDDTDRTISGLMAVTTKTDAQMERDDTAVGLEVYEPSFGVPIPPMRIH